MSVSFALGIPHTNWVPARVVSFETMLESLRPTGASDIRYFTDKEPNYVWSQKLWKWACETGATHLVQLQDDAIVAPDFWPKLRAMVTANPYEVIGLEAAHPLGPEQYRIGRRWYRTKAWLIGVGYVWPLDPNLPQGLPSFLNWCDENPEIVRKTNEDSLASQWLAGSGFTVWHPCPTIIDHDLSVESTYGNDGHHEFSMYRRPTVTWRDVPNVDALNDPAYWLAPSGTPVIPGPGTQECWNCAGKSGMQSTWTSVETGCRLCKQCVANCVGSAMGRMR